MTERTLEAGTGASDGAFARRGAALHRVAGSDRRGPRAPGRRAGGRAAGADPRRGAGLASGAPRGHAAGEGVPPPEEAPRAGGRPRDARHRRDPGRAPGPRLRRPRPGEDRRGAAGRRAAGRSDAPEAQELLRLQDGFHPAAFLLRRAVPGLRGVQLREALPVRAARRPGGRDHGRAGEDRLPDRAQGPARGGRGDRHHALSPRRRPALRPRERLRGVEGPPPGPRAGPAPLAFGRDLHAVPRAEPRPPGHPDQQRLPDRAPAARPSIRTCSTSRRGPTPTCRAELQPLLRSHHDCLSVLSGAPQLAHREAADATGLDAWHGGGSGVGLARLGRALPDLLRLRRRHPAAWTCSPRARSTWTCSRSTCARATPGG